MNNIMGKRIKERRELFGYTLEQVADRLGLQKSVISKYERGAVENIKRSHIMKLAEMFECNPSYLMGFTDNIEGDGDDSYYLDDYARDLARFLHQNPEYRVAFDATRKVKAEDLETVINVLDKFRDVQ